MLVSALGLLLRTWLTPGVDLDRYQRRRRHPQPANPRLAIEDPRWHAEHGGQVFGGPAMRLAAGAD